MRTVLFSRVVLRHVLPLVAAFAGGAFAARGSFAAPANADPLAVTAQLGEVLTIVENEYVDPVPRAKLLEGAIKGMVGDLDPHSEYMPPEDWQLFQSETQGQFGGVGVEVAERDGKILVLAAIEGSPAEKAGIKSGDRIVGIDGATTQEVPLDKLVRKMRGEPGSKVIVTLLSAEEKTRTVTLVREIIKMQSVVGKRLAGDVAYVRIRQFQAETHAQLLSVVGSLRKSGSAPLRGVILDLRANPGGLVDQAADVADEFLSGGTIFSTRHRGQVIEEASASRGGALVNEPMVVLVNEWSASAAELVAGALQDSGRARLVGQTTFGKGIVQTILDLPNGAGMKLTTMRYYTPKGRSIQATGITPDVLVERPVAADTPPAMRERDLEGSLKGEPDGLPPRPRPAVVKIEGAGGHPASPAEDTEVDPGAARGIPEDPSKGPGGILQVGYRVLLEQIGGPSAAAK